jgi:PAS domain S-box-containing protein
MGSNPDRFCMRVVREMPDAIVYSDAKGKICFWNRAAERIFGFSASEALGQSLDIIIPENLRERHWAGYDQTMRTGVTRYGAGDLLAVPAIRKDGSRISVEFTILPFREDDGGMAGIVAVLRDVTTRFEEIKKLKSDMSALRIKANF